MNLRTNRKAFTLVELLTVMAIIGLLVGIAIPSLSAAKKKAKELACKATITAMEEGLHMFHGDNGAYPSSTPVPAGVANTGKYDMNDKIMNTTLSSSVNAINVGAHRLTESLVGYDLLGNEKNKNYCDSSGMPLNTNSRKDYLSTNNLQVSTLANISSMNGFNVSNQVWNNQNPVIVDGLKIDKPMPFLYFKANTRGIDISTIFNFSDNCDVSSVITPVWTVGGPARTYKDFIYYAWDYRTGNNNEGSASARPYNKDSYIIISPGFDQEYGTRDDITNFDFTNGKTPVDGE